MTHLGTSTFPLACLVAALLALPPAGGAGGPRKPPGPAPDGMVWIPGGEFSMGSDDFPDARPVRKVHVDGFWMDRHEVTNEEFARFVQATNYVTLAERPPDPAAFPGVPPEEVRKFKPFSIVFSPPPPGEPVDPRRPLSWWRAVPGACWKHPEGPGSTVKGREKHPAVHVCWDDAVAYCKWAKKRLPAEAEWEFAARGGSDRKRYPWGDDLLPGDKWQANIWQGDFPTKNTAKDGFTGTAPVGSFPANGYGLHDTAGNVWEWCSDWYRPDYYKGAPAKNPAGPRDSHDPAEPGVPKRVQRGGSYLCADSYCVRYRVGARGKGEPTSAAGHTGFRGARSAE